MNTKTNYPPYYHVVNIVYNNDGREEVAKAWLAVNDNGHYVWTIANTDIVISDRDVKSWYS